MHTGLGLHITRRLLGSVSGASALLAGETDGLAFDFTNQSALIRDTSTPANAYNSIGIVNDGELVGPSGKLTYTSPSNKLTRQADGVIRYQAHNLCTYSEDLTNVNWLKGGSSATAVDTITEDGSTGAHRVYRQFASLPTADYRIKVRISASDRHIYFIAQNSSNLVYAWINTSTWTIAESGDNGSVTLDSATLTAVGDGTYDLDIVARNLVGAFFIQFYMADTIGTGPNPPSYAGDTVSTLAVSRIQLNLYPANTDYIKTTTAAKYALPIEYDTSGNCLGLLVEEQRTNLLVGNATAALHATSNTSVLGATITSGQADVSGGTAAGLITASASIGRHLIYSTAQLTVSSGTVYTLSCLMKAGTSQYGHLQIANSGGGAERYGAVFDLSGAGSVTDTDTNSTSPASTATSIESVGNGWYRCSLTMSSSTSTAQFWHVGISDSATPTWNIAAPSWNSSGTETVYYCYPQFEQGSFPTSPILTYGAAATRAADNISIATNAFPHATPLGSIFAHIQESGNANNSYVASLYFSAADRIQIYGTATTLDATSTHSTGGDLMALQASTGARSGESKIALAYNTDDTALCVNGGTVATDTTFDYITSEATALYVGSYGGGGANLNGHIKAISYVPRRKDDIELAVDTGYSLPTGYTTYGAWDLFGDESSALAFDFTDQSVVNTKTPLVSQGIVSDGELVGCGAALTYTSPSNKLTRQSDGYYKYQAHNLCTYSEDFSNAAWADASMTNTASTLVLDATTALTTLALGLWTSSAVYTSQQVTTATGATYEYAIEVALGSGLSHIQLRVGNNAQMNPLITYAGSQSWVLVALSDGSVVDGGSGVYTVTDLGGGYYRISVKFTATTTSAYCGIWCWNSSQISSAAGTEFYNVRKAHVYRYPANTDYIKTTSAAKYALPLEYDTSGNCLGLLVEEARTNLLTYATTYENAAWVDNVAGTGSAPVITDNAATAPDGTTTAATITLNLNGGTASGDVSGFYHSVSGLTVATAYTGSTYVKGTAGEKIGYRHVGASSYTIHTFSGDWERITVTETSISTSSSLDILLRGNLAGISDTVTFDIWVSQLEQGSFPTSPVVTYGAAASRLADNISIATSAFPFSSTVGALYSQFTTPLNLASSGSYGKTVVTLGQASGFLNTYCFSPYLTNNRFTYSSETNNTGTAAVNTTYKQAGAWAANDVAHVIDGGTVVTDNTHTLSAGITNMYVGNFNGLNGGYFGGHIKAISYVPRRMSNAELQTETS